MNRMWPRKRSVRTSRHFPLINKTSLFLLMTVLITLSTLYLSSFGFREGIYTSYLTNYPLLGLNAWPIAATLLLFFALFGRTRVAIYITFVFWHLIALLEFVKIKFRHESLKLYDYDLFGAAFQMGKRYLGAKLWLSLFVITAICLLLVFVVRLLPPLRGSRSARIFCLLFALVGSYCLSGVYFSVDTAGNLGSKELNTFVEPDGAMRNGYAYSLFFESRDGFMRKDKKQIGAGKKIAEQYPAKPLTDGPKVNVCVMLLESYKDFSDSDMTLALNRNPYAAFHELKKNALSGHFLANVYGGGTMQSEMAVLTGFDGKTPPGYYRHPHQSYVRAFYDQGYRTEAIHPYRGHFYNRAGFYPQLGFQQFFYEENHFKRNTSQDGILPDSELFKEVLKRFAAHRGKGPYFDDALYADPFFEKPAEMSIEDYHSLNNYLGGAESTSQALAMLCEKFEEMSEPVLFICFGDHSPALTDGVYKTLGMETDANTVQGFMNRYATPYLVWGNSACKQALGKEMVGHLPDTDPELLMAQVFHFLNWSGTPHQQFLAETAGALSSKKTNFVIEEGQLKREASAAGREILNKRKALEAYSKSLKLKPIEKTEE